MKFDNFAKVSYWFKTTENEKNHINYMRSRLTCWGGKFEPKDAAMWVIMSRLNLGVRTQELATSYLEEIEGGIFKNFSQIVRDFTQLRQSNPRLFF